MITFSGIDGAGKSTLTAKAAEYFRDTERNAVKLEVYATSTFLSMGRLIEGVSPSAKKKLGSTTSSSGSGIFFKVLRVFCFFIDIVIFRIKSIFLRKRKKVLLCDRYLYDTLVHLKYLKALNDGLYRFLLKLIPRPEAPFLLYLDSSSAKSREGQHDDEDYYSEKIKLYETLAGEAGLIRIDSSRESSKVWENVRRMIDTRIT